MNFKLRIKYISMNLSNSDWILSILEYFLLAAKSFYENCTALSIIRHSSQPLDFSECNCAYGGDAKASKYDDY